MGLPQPTPNPTATPKPTPNPEGGCFATAYHHVLKTSVCKAFDSNHWGCKKGAWGRHESMAACCAANTWIQPCGDGTGPDPTKSPTPAPTPGPDPTKAPTQAPTPVLPQPTPNPTATPKPTPNSKGGCFATGYHQVLKTSVCKAFDSNHWLRVARLTLGFNPAAMEQDLTPRSLQRRHQH